MRALIRHVRRNFWQYAVWLFLFAVVGVRDATGRKFWTWLLSLVVQNDSTWHLKLMAFLVDGLAPLMVVAVCFGPFYALAWAQFTTRFDGGRESVVEFSKLVLPKLGRDPEVDPWRLWDLAICLGQGARDGEIVIEGKQNCYGLSAMSAHIKVYSPIERTSWASLRIDMNLGHIRNNDNFNVTAAVLGDRNYNSTYYDLHIGNIDKALSWVKASWPKYNGFTMSEHLREEAAKRLREREFDPQST